MYVQGLKNYKIHVAAVDVVRLALAQSLVLFPALAAVCLV
jgi:hypothetical protein